MKRRTLSVWASIALLPLVACGGGLPALTGSEVVDQPDASAICSLTTGVPLNFNVTQQGSSIFWATDPQIQLPEDADLAKLLFDIPNNAIPLNALTPERSFVQVQVGREPNAFLPSGGHVDTAFRIQALLPSDMTGFVGSLDQGVLTLTLRYDPVACEIPVDVEATLVLGRLNSNGEWQEVCGTTADVGRHEVACAEGDLSFGVFGVIPQGSTATTDTTPPFFPLSAQSLSVQCADQACGTLLMRWGAALDETVVSGDAANGVVSYHILVDGNFTTATGRQVPASGVVTYTLVPTFNPNVRHIYHIRAEDAAGNLSDLFGGVPYP